MNNRFNGWTVLDNNIIIKNNDKFLLCKCDCGNEKIVRLKNLKSGISTNCGCKRSKKTIDRNKTHNLRYSKLYPIWRGMKDRCYNKKNRNYKNYGGRGIKVCDEWKNSFLEFYKFMGNPPQNKSIDRVNNDGDYTPENVRWATKQEQNENRRSSKKINGVCISHISISLGGAESMVGKRLKRGWAVDKAITIRANELLQNTKNKKVCL